jgi:hypothetical protein
MEGQRVHLGEEVALFVLTKTSAGAPVAPDAAPTFSIYNSAGTAIISDRKMPPVEKGATTGAFGCGQFLGDQFAEGKYVVLYKWVSGAFNGKQDEEFEIMPGGDGGGNCVAMAILRKPHTTYVVRQLTSGKIAAGRNPRV